MTSNPMLRRTNRIRTIYSSLAIEQNTLSLERLPSATANRILAKLADEGTLQKIRIRKSWGYIRIRKSWGYIRP